MSNQPKAKNCYVACLDILGFKELLDTIGSENLAKLYSDGLQKIETELAAEFENETIHSKISLLDSTEIETHRQRSSWKAFKFIDRPVVFSDSIIIFSLDDSRNSLIDISNYSNLIFQAFLFHELPIRGAISFGQCVIDHSSSLFVGDGIVKAVMIEQNLDIVGIAIDTEIPYRTFDHVELSVCTKTKPTNYLIPKYNPEGQAGYSEYVMWACFDKCREKAPVGLQLRYSQSESVLSVMISGKTTSYQSYRELIQKGKIYEAEN